MTTLDTLVNISVVLTACVLVISLVALSAGAATDGATRIAGDVESTDGTAEQVQTQSIDDVPIDASLERAASEQETTEVIVRMDASASSFATASADPTPTGLQREAAETQAALEVYADETPGVEVVNRFWIANAALVEVETDRTHLRNLATVDGVTRLHENFAVDAPEPVAGIEPDAADVETTYGLDQVNATDVWDEYDTRGAGASVAVLDTGVDPDHPDIDIDPANWAEIDDEGDRIASSPHDTGYHGTHVSGTIVGGNESGSYIGVAPDAELLHGLVLPDGSGSFAQIIGGMEWAVGEEADILSMSLGSEGYYEALIDPVQNAIDAGTLVITSSGNEGVETSGSPGNVYEALAIGASDEEYGVAEFSSGEVVDTETDWDGAAPDHWPDEYVVPDLVAPGDHVRSAVPEGTFPDDPDVAYGYASGTSMAAPHVSGVAALAMSASGTDDPDELSAAIEHSARTPADCTPSCSPRDGKDERYGLGIVDSKISTDLLAANQGVSGTVTAPDGDGVAGVLVEFADGHKTVTEADGTFELRAPAGTYSLTAGAGLFGFTSDSQPVTVTEDTFETVDIELEETVDVTDLTDQPDRIEAGDGFTVESEVANVDALTVTAAGDYETSDVTMSVNGEPAGFGDPISFDSYTGPLTIDVETANNTSGNLSLTQELAGDNESVTVTSGLTRIVPELIPVGVVDDPDEDRVGANALINALEGPDGPLPVEYDLSVVETPALRDSFGAFDIYVVHSFGSYEQDAELIEDFVDETGGSDTGVVYLDQYALHANSVPALSEATNDPADTFQESINEPDADLTYDVEADHPLVDGVGDVGDSVVIHDDFRNDHAWFEEFSGQTVATVSLDSETAGPALAVDDLSRTVLASSLGYTSRIVIGDYTPAADRILTNAIIYAESDPPMDRTADQPAHVESGEPITQEFSVTQLAELEVGIGDASTVAPENLTLLADGTEIEFDEPIEYDGLTEDNFTITVIPDDDVIGTVSTDLTFVGELGDSVLTSSATTSIYTPPLIVGDNVDDIHAAQNLAPSDEHTPIYLEDGVYDEPVEISTNDVSLRPVEGATPTFAPDGAGDAVVTIDATNVDIRDIEIDATDIVDEEGDAGDGVVLYGSENVTMAGLSIDGGAVGAHLRFAPGNVAESASNDVVLENATITDANKGVRLSDNTFGPPGNYTVSNTTVTNSSEMGIEITAREAVVRDSYVSGGDPVIQISGAEYGSVLEDTVIDGTGADQGIYALLSEDLAIRNNEILNASTGIDLFDFGASGTITGNEIATDTGIDLGGVSDALFTVRGNHLGDSDLALAESSEFDARLNYYGPSGPINATVTDGIDYKPYLTSPLEDVDQSVADLEQTTDIGIDVTLSGGEPTALGIPGSTTQTVDELFPGEPDGVIYGFDAEQQAWDRLTGDDSLSALEAVMVVTDEETHAHFEFRSEDEPIIPGQIDLEEGWNFVAPPTYGGADDAFRHAMADVSLITHDVARPTGQIGPAGELEGVYDFSGDDPNLSPFEGYFIFADDGTVPAELLPDPSIAELYAQLEAGDPGSLPAVDDADDPADVTPSTGGLVSAPV